MAVLTAQEITRAGVVPALAAAASGGDTFVEDGSGRMFVEAANGSGAPITVTFVSTAVPATNSGVAAANLAVAVAGGASRLIGPISAGFINASTRVVSMTYSTHTDLTVGVFKLSA